MRLATPLVLPAMAGFAEANSAFSITTTGFVRLRSPGCRNVVLYNSRQWYKSLTTRTFLELLLGSNQKYRPTLKQVMLSEATLRNLAERLFMSSLPTIPPYRSTLFNDEPSQDTKSAEYFLLEYPEGPTPSFSSPESFPLVEFVNPQWIFPPPATMQGEENVNAEYPDEKYSLVYPPHHSTSQTPSKLNRTSGTPPAQPTTFPGEEAVNTDYPHDEYSFLYPPNLSTSQAPSDLNQTTGIASIELALVMAPDLPYRDVEHFLRYSGPPLSSHAQCTSVAPEDIHPLLEVAPSEATSSAENPMSQSSALSQPDITVEHRYPPVHLETGRWMCTVPGCRATTARRHDMVNRHMDKHLSGAKRVSCPDCGTFFLRKDGVQWHKDRQRCRLGVVTRHAGKAPPTVKKAKGQTSTAKLKGRTSKPPAKKTHRTGKATNSSRTNKPKAKSPMSVPQVPRRMRTRGY